MRYAHSQTVLGYNTCIPLCLAQLNTYCVQAHSRMFTLTDGIQASTRFQTVDLLTHSHALALLKLPLMFSALQDCDKQGRDEDCHRCFRDERSLIFQEDFVYHLCKECSAQRSLSMQLGGQFELTQRAFTSHIGRVLRYSRQV